MPGGRDRARREHPVRSESPEEFQPGPEDHGSATDAGRQGCCHRVVWLDPIATRVRSEVVLL